MKIHLIDVHNIDPDANKPGTTSGIKSFFGIARELVTKCKAIVTSLVYRVEEKRLLEGFSGFDFTDFIEANEE